MTDLKTEMLEDARWVDAHALYNFKESQNHDALRQSQRAAKNLRAAASLLPAPQPEAVITEEMVERAYEAFVAACEWSDWDAPEVRGYLRAAITAALKEA